MSNNRNKNNNSKNATAAPSMEEIDVQLRNLTEDSIKQLSEHTQESLEALDEKFSSSIRNNVQELNNKIKAVHNETTAVNQKAQDIMKDLLNIIYDNQSKLNKSIEEIESQLKTAIEYFEAEKAVQKKRNLFYESLFVVLSILWLISFL